MSKITHIQNFLKNIIKNKDFIDIDSFFDNIPENCIFN